MEQAIEERGSCEQAVDEVERAVLKLEAVEWLNVGQWEAAVIAEELVEVRERLTVVLDWVLAVVEASF